MDLNFGFWQKEETGYYAELDTNRTLASVEAAQRSANAVEYPWSTLVPNSAFRYTRLQQDPNGVSIQQQPGHVHQLESGRNYVNEESAELQLLRTGVSVTKITPQMGGHDDQHWRLGLRDVDRNSPRNDLFPQDSIFGRRIRPSLTSPDPRLISFRKEGSVGIRLTGGNQVGIFVTAVQPGSPAVLQGLEPGDKLLKVNDMDMKGVTREEAVLFLLSLQDQVDLIVQYRPEEYRDVLAHQKGDSFFIKAHFNYDNPQKGEMSFRKGDVFHVVDTLHSGVVGSWQVYRIGRHNEETQRGLIPNKSRAEELATAQWNTTSDQFSVSVGNTKRSFFRRKRAARRSKSLCQDPFDDMLLCSDDSSIYKFPAYERVSLRHPGFTRPVVLMGALADIARERLVKESPERFCSPQKESGLADGTKKQQGSPGVIRLSAIREIMDRSKHAVLDVTPNAVDKLNYAQLYPITIFIKADSKAQIKDLRSHNKLKGKSSRKLLDQCMKLEKHWSQIFTGTLNLAGTTENSWYSKMRVILARQQNQPIWMSEIKPPSPPETFFSAAGFVPASQWLPPLRDFPADVDALGSPSSSADDNDDGGLGVQGNGSKQSDRRRDRRHRRLPNFFRRKPKTVSQQQGRFNLFHHLPTFL